MTCPIFIIIKRSSVVIAMTQLLLNPWLVYLELIHILAVSVLQQILVQGSPLPATNAEADIVGSREVAHSQVA